MAKSRLSGSLDTNVLLRFLLDDVSSQSKAIEKLLEEGGAFEVADSALIECVYVLEKFYKMGRSLVVENVFAITRNKQFVTNRKMFETALPFYISHQSLSIIDCVLLAHTRLRKTTPLYSFDADLIKRSERDATAPV